MISFSSPHLWPQHLKVLLAGNAGTGKTALAATFPQPLFIDCANNISKVVTGEIRPFIKATNELELRSAHKVVADLELQRELLGDYEIQTVVLDGVEELQRRMLLERMQDNGRTETLIEDWGWIATKLNAILDSFSSLPVHLVATCRLNTEQEKLLIQGQFHDQIHNYVDYALLTERTLDIDFSGIETALVDGEITLTNLPEGADAKFEVSSIPNKWTHSISGEIQISNPTFDNLWDIHTEAGTNAAELSGIEIADMDEAQAILGEIFRETHSLSSSEDSEQPNT